MKKSLLLAKGLAMVCVLIFSQLIFIQSSQATTPTYTAEFTVTGFNSSSWITRSDGFIWVSQNSAIKKVDEVTGSVSATYTLESTPLEIAFDGTNVFAILTDSRIAKLTVASGTVSYSASAVCTSGSSNDSIAANADVIIVSCFLSGKVARYQNSNLTELERVNLSSAGRVVIANNFAYVTQFSGSNPTWKYSLSSLLSPTSIATANYSSTYHRVTADSNYVWILSGNTQADPRLAHRLVRISLNNNAVTTITLNDYNPFTHTFNSISSDGTTLFITYSGTLRIVAFDIATSTITTTITPASTPNGIKAVTNGFWAVVGSNLIKYSSASAPAAPTLNSVTGGDKRVTVAFTAGANNGASITDYEYSLNSGSYISAGTTTSPFTITGLSGRTSYSITIKARNSSGLGSASSSISATTTDSALDASEAAAETARVTAAAAAAAQAARLAREQKELTEIMAMIPKLGELTLSLGEVTRSLTSTQCVKRKTTKNVKKGAKCPKGFVRAR
jgi:hypothetical protein